MSNTKGLEVGIFPSRTLRFILYTVICVRAICLSSYISGSDVFSNESLIFGGVDDCSQGSR